MAKRKRPCITFYHDIEQNLDSMANPDECRRIVREFLTLEQQYDVVATYNVAGKLFEEQPDLIQWILDAGMEVAFHSCSHRTDWAPEHYSEEIRRCREISPKPRGYRSPRSQWNQETLETLWDSGFLWSAENDAEKTEPYFIHKGLVRMPILTDDWSLYKGIWTIERWTRHFTKAVKSKPYVAIGCHDYIVSFEPEKRLKAWEQLLRTAKDWNGLTVNFSEAADLFRRASVSRHYNVRAKDWNRVARLHYRSKRFQEIIRDEAMKIGRPVVADLASGGGVQSRVLRGIAEHVYCVDNSAGMIAEVTQDGCVEGVLGEMTSTNLPNDSVDMVFCVNAVEYLFWPDAMADEIKRIGKLGATYLVAFPALGGSPSHVEQSPPNRIQRYFTKEDVRKWSEQIGAGQVFGIQYDSREPGDPETEQRYRQVECTPPMGVQPKVWMVVGHIQDKNRHENRHRTIPISACPFHFPRQRFDGMKHRIRQLLLRMTPKPLRKSIKIVLEIVRK